MSAYTDTIRQWATDTRRTGILADADGTGEVGLESSQVGQRLAVRFTLKVELDRVVDARYQVFGCGFSMAACAVAADLAVGYGLDEVQRIDSQRLDTALEGLPPERSYCADLAVEALQAAVRSTRRGHRTEETSLRHEAEHGARVSVDDPLYRALVESPVPERVTDEDRHLFACLLTVAAQESQQVAVPLGLAAADVDSILQTFFPGVDRAALVAHATTDETPVPECNPEIHAILCSYLPTDPGHENLLASVWLAYIIAARAALPGHLWVAMGLTERPQLTAAIRRHLPALADANSQNMRWKRFLYKQVCDRNGGMMCKAPNCGVCSDYALCFAEER